ncbi:MAG: NAD(P)-binding domain-containing protein, partial [Candidatus Dadabacteria bacterium]|nr:NAD(P)-binding domain-containing protein [Candidatus Dadabacteria bacterium]
MAKIGFIGGGNMAEALVKGLIASGAVKKSDITVSEPVDKRRSYLKSTYGVAVTGDNKEAASGSDVVILSVKPNTIKKAILEIKPQITAKKILVSIAAGITTASIAAALKKKAKIVRVMPNTPALVLSGASVLYCAPGLSPEEREQVRKIFESVGTADIVEDEKLL